MSELIKRLRDTVLKESKQNYDKCYEAADALEQQAKQIEELKLLCDRLKQEAQIHAQEARTANATIAEIYQCVTGSNGEPGNWSGAKPVRDKIEELAAALTEKDEALRIRAEYDPTYPPGAVPTNDCAKALAIQPHASLVAKIKADAVREAVSALATEPYGYINHAALNKHADRIELEGK